MNSDVDGKFTIQADQYQFPYHYLPDLDHTGAVSTYKNLSWGLDYITYMHFIAHLIKNTLRPQSLLDIGCGDGRLLNMLQDQVPQLVGVDLVKQAVLFAKAFNPSLRIYLCDVSQVPGQFELATLVEVMEHIPDPAYPEFINKVANKLTPNGKLVVSVPTTNLPLNKKHYRHYDLSLLQEQLNASFQIENYWYLTKNGSFYELFRWLLQPTVGIVQPSSWRRIVWRLHRKCSYMASSHTGRHLVAVARLR
ncbi:MAG: class I SAM-dependent methyltransferase [Anaerolineaceae bacterium]|nr:class I SAM-dependent methyltransferase [Anaerolineaceae bacterium]MCB9102234.1 class I SAM-dependent methyltransferase [Anaerolineales bacterium]